MPLSFLTHAHQGIFMRQREMLKTQVPKNPPPLTQFRNVSLPTFTVFAKFLGYFRPDNMCLKKGATAGGSLGGSKGGSINKGGSGGSL